MSDVYTRALLPWYWPLTQNTQLTTDRKKERKKERERKETRGKLRQLYRHIDSQPDC